MEKVQDLFIGEEFKPNGPVVVSIFKKTDSMIDVPTYTVLVKEVEVKLQIKKKLPKPKETGCSFCNGISGIESTGGDNWGKIRFQKNKSILDVELDAICYECDENIPCYSEFNIKYCPMCGYEVSNFKEQRTINKFFFVGDSNNGACYLNELIRLGGVCNDPCMTGSNPSLIYYIEQTTNYICSTHISNRNKYLEMDYVDISNIDNA